ncbi:hypothetical protein BH11PLA1_BH11PLA1_14100 [soil metagenome]
MLLAMTSNGVWTDVDDLGKPLPPISTRDAAARKDERVEALVLEHGGASGTASYLVPVKAGDVGIYILAGAASVGSLLLCNQRGWPEWIALGVFFLVSVPLLVRYGSGKNLITVALRDALLVENRCAGCALELDGAGESENGIVRCPECSAEWRFPRPASKSE